MKIFVSAVFALFAVAATAQAGNLVSSCGTPVRSASMGTCVSTSGGENMHADCMEMGMGPGKG